MITSCLAIVPKNDNRVFCKLIGLLCCKIIILFILVIKTS